MNLPSLSVLIPTYNRAHLVGRAIRNALDLVEADDEILVVDDGSTDATAEVVAGFGSRVRYLLVPHGGAGAARNHGVRAVTRPLLAFLDSDDEWMPDKLRLQRTLMVVRPDVLFSFTDFAGRSEAGVEPNYLRQWHHDERPWDEILGPGLAYSSLAELPLGRPDFRVHFGSIYLAEMLSDYVATTTVMVRREAAGAALVFADDIPISEDKECFARLARVGLAAYLDCETSYQWAHGGARVTDVANGYRLACARLKIMERIWGRDEEFLEQHGDAYRAKKRQQHLTKVKALLVRGQTREAREEIDAAGGAPLSYRFLASMPGVVARGLLAMRRLIRG